MKVIICGGRDLDPCDERYWNFLDTATIQKITHVVEGGAKGGDRIGRMWARHNNIPVTTIKADWVRYGKRAGYIRNCEMRDTNPAYVIALPGGKGTQMMIQLAEEKGIPVIKYNDT